LDNLKYFAEHYKLDPDTITRRMKLSLVDGQQDWLYDFRK